MEPLALGGTALPLDLSSSYLGQFEEEPFSEKPPLHRGVRQARLGPSLPTGRGKVC